MLMWLAARAFAQGSPAEPCGPPMLLGTLPADGDADVLPAVVITIVFQAEGGSSCGGAFFFGELWDADFTTPVAAGFRTDPTGLVVTMTPEAPLEVGQAYHLFGDAASGPVDVQFTVGEGGLPMTAPDATVEVEAQPTCGSLPRTTLVRRVVLDAPKRGLLQARTLSDGIAEPWVTLGLVDGSTTTWEGVSDVLGAGHEHCAEARLLDETGAEVWVVTGSCAATEPCPEPLREAEESGCSTVGGAGRWLALLPALVARRRRQPRAARNRTR
ncbi:MAG: hypothetical protein H6738_10375 [Alphaproteobacteria bacterium]|nr:hypothetical protein [Alphaproteobacteria bacterium]MCB9697174.1 hypothetical protein [Alphaproteobacteria bacterium]